MMMHGTAARALQLFCGLAILGLAGSLPLALSWAQETGGAGQPTAAQAPGQRDQIGDKLQALEKAQADIRRLQQEVDRARQDLERRTRELTRKRDQVRQAAAGAANAPPAAERKSFPSQAGPGSAPAMGATGTPGSDLEKRLREVERKL